MNRKKYLAVLLGLSTLLPVHAAYVNGEMLFEETFASPESLSKWKISGKVTRLEKGGSGQRPLCEAGGAETRKRLDFPLS